MRFCEIIESYLGITTLVEDQFVTEMGNFLADVTHLPANIVLWTKTQPKELPHNKYRMKVFKDRAHVATFSISENPKLIWQLGRKKYSLDVYEETESKNIIAEFSSLFIQLVDGKIDTATIKYEIKKMLGEQ
ncbi:hypothetical protein UFOVP116_172 [uncultured Caudovirales phage]|uniref:Uncharacterized protein n=1 Tax=uncultured Caudovirales phage TaxID=2100421 RepID=A0A6J5L727_9CAUD|nr:hypothetical protein UFOVP116_172 [uncultured Caudovirales phage]